MNGRVWLITGASRGLGQQWAIAALDRGDRVVATSRNIGALAALQHSYGESLYPIELDVTDRQACFEAVRAAHHRFGRIDVVVNNAGYGQYGFVEELSEVQARAQLETNFFGALWITQAVLPYLRAQRSGHILQVSSIGVLAFPNLGTYHASKWALEGLSQSRSGEVEPFGIRVTIVEPGGFDTDWVTAAPHARKHWPPMTCNVRDSSRRGSNGGSISVLRKQVGPRSWRSWMPSIRRAGYSSAGTHSTGPRPNTPIG